MRHSNKVPEVNAGSMADIAFLLLIFFLVSTTIPNDKGIVRKIPEPCPPGQKCDTEINERNLLSININKAGELFVNETITSYKDLKTVLTNFIDNNGDATCTYCNGDKIASASDNPKKASISIKTHPKTPYKAFITVQNELTAAYLELREAYAETILKKEEGELTEEEIKQVQQAYPFRISEADIK
ncbi:biopolymer transporter ExbD [uncultured Marixanthomonas sp.]|uniref:ExbD/TolR family protein n=1 Tax=uncultured Marixanthomonas sp. TaxID=757245 RepID=UPI0030DAB98A|tara:strand:+ start:22760 stop:23317 length:558 start_codon:yes stop_codon:yes gene_type:complete